VLNWFATRERNQSDQVVGESSADKGDFYFDGFFEDGVDALFWHRWQHVEHFDGKFGVEGFVSLNEFIGKGESFAFVFGS